MVGSSYRPRSASRATRERGDAGSMDVIVGAGAISDMAPIGTGWTDRRGSDNTPRDDTSD